jgi:hypothetical protein
MTDRVRSFCGYNRLDNIAGRNSTIVNHRLQVTGFRTRDGSKVPCTADSPAPQACAQKNKTPVEMNRGFYIERSDDRTFRDYPKATRLNPVTVRPPSTDFT